MMIHMHACIIIIVTNEVENNLFYIIIGSAPTNLILDQINVTMVTVSWTPPPAPPTNGYRITVDSEAGIDTVSSSQDIHISVPLGVHTIRVQSRSIHFPGGITTMDFNVLGIYIIALMYYYIYKLIMI